MAIPGLAGQPAAVRWCGGPHRCPGPGPHPAADQPRRRRDHRSRRVGASQALRHRLRHAVGQRARACTRPAVDGSLWDAQGIGRLPEPPTTLSITLGRQPGWVTSQDAVWVQSGGSTWDSPGPGSRTPGTAPRPTSSSRRYTTWRSVEGCPQGRSSGGPVVHSARVRPAAPPRRGHGGRVLAVLAALVDLVLPRSCVGCGCPGVALCPVSPRPSRYVGSCPVAHSCWQPVTTTGPYGGPCSPTKNAGAAIWAARSAGCSRPWCSRWCSRRCSRRRPRWEPARCRSVARRATVARGRFWCACRPTGPALRSARGRPRPAAGPRRRPVQRGAGGARRAAPATGDRRLGGAGPA